MMKYCIFKKKNAPTHRKGAVQFINLKSYDEDNLLR